MNLYDFPKQPTIGGSWGHPRCSTPYGPKFCQFRVVFWQNRMLAHHYLEESWIRPCQCRQCWHIRHFLVLMTYQLYLLLANELTERYFTSVCLISGPMSFPGDPSPFSGRVCPEEDGMSRRWACVGEAYPPPQATNT